MFPTLADASQPSISKPVQMRIPERATVMRIPFASDFLRKSPRNRRSRGMGEATKRKQKGQARMPFQAKYQLTLFPRRSADGKSSFSVGPFEAGKIAFPTVLTVSYF